MRALWAPQTRFGLWLEIERTETQLDVVAFLRSVAEETGAVARFLHRGLGSSDVVDTAQSILLVRAADLIDAALDDLRAALRDLALRHRDTAMAGRTHGVLAEPITFGLKAALWYSEARRGQERVRRGGGGGGGGGAPMRLGVKAALWYSEARRGQERLRRAREGVRVGKLSGEVGNYAHLDPRVEAHVCAALGLVPAPVSSQVLQRDRHAEFLCALAVLGGTLERIATDIRTLQRTEIREAEEPFRGGQTGSSAMPHKRNPILCERICGLARIVRGHALAAMENQALWGERDISHSSAERIAFPQATTLIHYMTRLLAGVIRGLRVYPEAMRRNLWRYGGIVFSHAVLLALLEKGLPRDEAYAAVQSVALEALDADGDFRALIAARGWLAPARLEQCFDLTPYLRHVPMIIDRVLVGEAARSEEPVGGR